MGVYWFNGWTVQRELRDIIAQIERKHAGWQLHDLERNRRQVPDDENGAVVIRNTAAKLPKGWLDDTLWPEIADIPLAVAMDELKLDALRALVQKADSARKEAAKLVGLPHGRFPITYSPDFISTLVPHLTDVQSTTYFLFQAARLHVEEGNTEEAWRLCKAIINAGRTLADEPLILSQLVRLAAHARAVELLERLLAQTQPSDKMLAEACQVLESLAEENLFLVGTRGELAGFHVLFSTAADGGVDLSDVHPSSAMDWLAGRQVVRSHIYTLKHLSRMLDAAELADDQRYERVRELDEEFQSDLAKKQVPGLARMLTPALRKIADADQRQRTRLFCACTALAAERFRLKSRRWPDSAEQLLNAGFLKRTFVDLFDNQPLRWRRTPDGLVIYSIGPDKNYKGDARDANRPRNDPRFLEFRLWNAESRRQPP